MRPGDQASGENFWKAESADINMPGELRPATLYVVATPIGNLQDISLRALGVLGAVDLVAAEDTRRAGMLLKAFHLKKPLMSCFAHNEEKQSWRILELLQEGKTVALVSDAGTPGISDPGARLIRRAVQAGVAISVVPGPCAGIAALTASGLDTESFAFGGFIPRNNKERKVWLTRFGSFTGTVILYESPKRLLATLSLIKESWGDRRCCVAREMTKRYEEFLRGSLTEVAGRLDQYESVRGEIVIVVEGSGNQETQSFSPEEMEELGTLLLRGGLHKKEASRKLARITGKSIKMCYDMLVNQEI